LQRPVKYRDCERLLDETVGKCDLFTVLGHVARHGNGRNARPQYLCLLDQVEAVCLAWHDDICDDNINRDAPADDEKCRIA